MDQVKVGKFISQCRKEKGLTQVQVAERFGVSNAAVSKWETGKSIPDASIMLALCELLGITANELLSGERIRAEEYKEKAEKKLVDMQLAQERLKKMTNMRKFTFYFYHLVGLFGIACAVFQASLFVRIVCAAFVVCAVACLLESSRCAGCGKYGVNTNPHSAKFGTCKYCGEKH